ncbi:hypothetical protein APY03_4821 [Variovorax sp. WDL1]|nr:hypothetical protein APY03_4821 [Variovorax sp. WDL1]
MKCGSVFIGNSSFANYPENPFMTITYAHIHNAQPTARNQVRRPATEGLEFHPDPRRHNHAHVEQIRSASGAGIPHRRVQPTGPGATDPAVRELVRAQAPPAQPLGSDTCAQLPAPAPGRVREQFGGYAGEHPARSAQPRPRRDFGQQRYRPDFAPATATDVRRDQGSRTGSGVPTQPDRRRHRRPGGTAWPLCAEPRTNAPIRPGRNAVCRAPCRRGDWYLQGGREELGHGPGWK